MYKPKVVLVVVDGWGYSPVHKGNAIWAAKTPAFDYMWNVYAHTLLNAYGENVGLPWGSIGSSEVGHTSIGCGKLIPQELSLIDQEIKEKRFFENKTINDFIRKTSTNKKNIHIVGLLSNGGVHSHLEHLFAFFKVIKSNHFAGNVFIHIITDGRDTSPKSAKQFIGELNKAIGRTRINARVASVSGRYYAMDRDSRWDRTKKAYFAIVEGKGDVYNTPEEAVDANYKKNINDEFIVPSVINLNGDKKNSIFNKFLNKAKNDKEIANVESGDGVIFYNTRSDRMRQICEMFLFDKNEIGTRAIKGVNVLTLTTYDERLPVSIAYPTEKAKYPLAKILSDHKIKQGHFAETEKYAHVTYFFNGSNPEPYPLESWFLVHSPNVATYDLKPQMSAQEITSSVFREVEKKKLDFVLINYANCDMVGHTGNFSKVIKAVECVDGQLKKLLKFLPETTLLITADHGNAECMIHPETGEVDKHHTVNPVPFIIVNDKFRRKADAFENTESSGILADVAPTVIDLFGLQKPSDMNGVSLLDSLKDQIQQS